MNKRILIIIAGVPLGLLLVSVGYALSGRMRPGTDISLGPTRTPQLLIPTQAPEGPTTAFVPTATALPCPVPTQTALPTAIPTAAPTTTLAPPTATATPLVPTTLPPTRVVPTTMPTAGPFEPSIVVTRLNTSQPVVALTFDAGADAGHTAQILDTLAANGIRASFGLTGAWAEAHPALVRRIASEGHTIINHTYSHRSFTGFSTGESPLTYAERADELWRAQAAILNIADASTKPYFRPPYGDYDQSVLRDVASRGYPYTVLWSVDSLGWQGASEEQIVARVLDGLEPGTMYLFHVGSQSQDGAALPDLIGELRAQGYAFATVSDFCR